MYAKKSSASEINLWGGKGPLLTRLDIELTERCNNACLHCGINLPEKDRVARSREMDTAFAVSILQQAADLGCLQVCLTGGEPLLRDDFAEIYLKARRLGFKVQILTNARLMTRELADLLAHIPPGRPVEITVYGMRPETYDAATGARGAFKEFRGGVDLLLGHKIPIIVKFAVLPPNRSEIDAFETWAKILSLSTDLPSYILSYELRTRRDRPDKDRKIIDLRLSPVEVISFLTRDPAYAAKMRRFCNRFIGPRGDILFGCGAGHGVCVDAYGRAHACIGLRHPDSALTLGTNGDGSLKSALTHFFPRLLQKRSINPEYLRRCARCFLMGLCEQCPAKSWSEYGVLDRPVEYLCAIAHAEARYLDLLEGGENAWEIVDWESRVKRLANRSASSEFPV